MIKIGIIGTGGMASSQVERFQKIKGVKVVACADVDVTRAQAFAKKALHTASLLRFYGNA